MKKKTIIALLGALLLNSCLKQEDYVPFEYTIRVYVIPVDNLNLKTLKINNYKAGELNNERYTYNREDGYYDFTGLKKEGDYEIIIEVDINGNTYTKYETISIKEDKINPKTIKFDEI